MWRIVKLKKVWIPLLIVVAVIALVMYQNKQNAKPKYVTEVVVKQDLKQTVSVTGTVEAAEDLDLNFKIGGRLSNLPVKIGDVVKRGILLAALESGDVRASVLSAESQVKLYQAQLDKLNAGAQLEDVFIYQTAVKTATINLDNVKKTQEQSVKNTFAQLVGLAPQAVPDDDNVSTATIGISGTYNGMESGIYTITIANSTDLYYSISGLENISSTKGSKIYSTKLGNSGLNMIFSSTGTIFDTDSWEVKIPNPNHASYATYKAAYDAALVTQKKEVEAAEQALAKAQADLALKQAPPRTYDITVAEAQLESAQASLAKARSDLADRSIVSPVAGTVTKINYQLGETTSLVTPVLVLLSEGNYKIKVKVPEADVAKLAKDQSVDITLDAFGSGQHFAGHIYFIDPAATPLTDAVYYEVTILFDNTDQHIKPGMTANVDVNTGNRTDSVVIPLRAVKYDSEFKPFVEILNGESLIEREINLGLKGDDGLVEVLSGLQEGELVVTSKTNGK